jgi:hypothetical protein
VTHPETEVGGANDTVVAAEPTIEDRFAAFAGDDEGEDQPGEAAAEAEAPETAELTPEDVTEAPEAETPPIKPPVSWTAEEQEAFKTLPRAMQETLTRREAERERFVQSKAQEAKQARSQVESEARSAIEQLQETYSAQLQVLIPQIPERPSHQLQADDPWEYAKAMDVFERTVAQVQYAQQQLQTIQQQREQAEQTARTQEVQREAAALRETLPEWFDETEGPKLRQRAQSIAQHLGYSAEQLNDATANEISALVKASGWKAKAEKYDTLMAKKMEQVRAAKELPRVSKPGVPAGKGAIANERYTADRQAMKSGDRDATARVFSNFV